MNLKINFIVGVLMGLPVFGTLSPIHAQAGNLSITTPNFITYTITNPAVMIDESNSTANLYAIDFTYGILSEEGTPGSSIPIVVQSEGQQLLTKPLVYPNPFRLNSNPPAALGYELSEAMDIELRVYNMFGQQVVRKRLIKGADDGALPDWNEIKLNRDFFNYDAPSGVYIFLLINNGKVLDKGKFVIMP